MRRGPSACLLTRATLSVVIVSDHPDAVVAILHDLTAERDFQEELLRNQKLATLGEFTFGAGILFFPLSYVFKNILTEVYGYAHSRRVVWAGFGALAFSAVMSAVVVGLPPAAGIT